MNNPNLKIGLVTDLEINYKRLWEVPRRIKTNFNDSNSTIHTLKVSEVLNKYSPKQASAIKNFTYYRQLNLIEEITIKNLKEKIDQVYYQLKKPNIIIGGEDHVKACKELVQTKLILNTLATAKANNTGNSPIIEADVEIQNIDLGFKVEYVMIDPKHANVVKNWHKVQSIQHLFVCVYAKDCTNIFTSDMMTLIERCEAEKYSIPYKDPREYGTIKIVNLHDIQVKSRLIIEVFIMDYQPIKPKKGFSGPVKKLSRHRSAVNDSHFSSNPALESSCPPVSFTNTMKYEKSLFGIQEIKFYFDAKESVHNSCILNGYVSFWARLHLKMKKTIEGQLNVCTDEADGKCKWTWYYCWANSRGIEGTVSMDSFSYENSYQRVFIPWAWCHSLVAARSRSVYSSPRSLCIRIYNSAEEIKIDKYAENTLFNERISANKNFKRRFLFEAPTNVDYQNWRDIISEAILAYHSFKE